MSSKLLLPPRVRLLQMALSGKWKTGWASSYVRGPLYSLSLLATRMRRIFLCEGLFLISEVSLYRGYSSLRTHAAPRKVLCS